MKNKEDLYDRSGAVAFGIHPDEFCQILKNIADRAGVQDPASFLQALKLEDLALAQGCARGNNTAWERFAALYGGRLQAIALSITHEESSARELAGSLYSDLFGSRKLLSYSGRGSLEGWLRAVLAQQYINTMRAGRRLTSYEAEMNTGMQIPSRAPEAPLPDVHLAASVDSALSTLRPDERFLLASYYLDSHTLAEIAQTLGVHESTISRRMDKLVIRLRKHTKRELRTRGITGDAAEEMLGSDVRDVDVDVVRRLLQIPSSKSGATK